MPSAADPDPDSNDEDLSPGHDTIIVTAAQYERTEKRERRFELVLVLPMQHYRFNQRFDSDQFTR